jgi:hypothetical protein
MLNREVFRRDPLDYSLPNDGVAKVQLPTTENEWDVARYELESFVCEGEYHNGLRRILESFIRHLDQDSQPGVWVHGFYGSGKSQLLRILDFLWSDRVFPDGARSRDIVRSLPEDITDTLRELTNLGRRYGGLWSAPGTLGAGSADDPRAAFLQVVLRAAGLPESVNQAAFDLWLREEGIHQDLVDALEARGRNYRQELRNLYVSQHLAEELYRLKPGLAQSVNGVLEQLRAQFPLSTSITTDAMVDTMRRVFAQVGERPDRSPLVLLVLDELQQYIGDSTDRCAEVLDAVEACVSEFGSQLLLVAAGQSALTPDTPMSRLQGRFTVHVRLGDREVESVLRNTILQKKTEALEPLGKVLEQASGELRRHLQGTSLEMPGDGSQHLIADYPLLPTRRRFWEAALKAVDAAGAAQLRTQLRLAFEAARAVGDQELGVVVGADFLFDQLRTTLVERQVLLQELEDRIVRCDDDTPEGRLKARACGLLFLIEKLDPTLGVRGNVDTLADLMTTDLRVSSAELRKKLPELLEDLVEKGVLARVEDEYRLQTREGQVWDGEYRKILAEKRSDANVIHPERDRRLRAVVEGRLANLTLTQGVSRTPRSFQLCFDNAPPRVEGKIPVWVRTGWDIREQEMEGEARRVGLDSPVVFVFIPKEFDDQLRESLAGFLAANEVLQTRSAPTTPEGQEARRAMESRRDTHAETCEDILEQLVEKAKVWQGGGTPVESDSFRSAVQQALTSAMTRLYPQFQQADHDKWEQVFNRARQGDGEAIAAVGHNGEAARHPVCAELLRALATEKQGSELRQTYEAPPYGWPRNAIDAALVVLCQSGHVSARDPNGRPLSLDQLNATSLQRARFRSETVAPLSANERIELRQMLQTCEMPARVNNEAVELQELLSKIAGLIVQASGTPPLPARPTESILEELRGLEGNALLQRAFELKSELSNLFREWKQKADLARRRLPAWSGIVRLLNHAEGLPAYEDLKKEADAILANCALLNEPDPVSPLLNSLGSALRDALQQARQAHLERFDALLAELERRGVLAPREAFESGEGI